MSLLFERLIGREPSNLWRVTAPFLAANWQCAEAANAWEKAAPTQLARTSELVVVETKGIEPSTFALRKGRTRSEWGATPEDRARQAATRA